LLEELASMAALTDRVALLEELSLWRQIARENAASLLELSG